MYIKIINHIPFIYVNYIIVIIIVIKTSFQPKNHINGLCCWMTDFVFKLHCFADIYTNKVFALLKP